MRSGSLPDSVDGFADYVWFSRGLFEHVDRVRNTGTAMKSKKRRAIVHHHVRRVLLETIADAVTKKRSSGIARLPPVLLAEYVVGTFMLVLSWWVESRSSLSSRDVNEVFLSLVRPTLTTFAEAH